MTGSQEVDARLSTAGPAEGETWEHQLISMLSRQIIKAASPSVSCDVFEALLGMMVHCTVQRCLKANADEQLGICLQLALDLSLLWVGPDQFMPSKE